MLVYLVPGVFAAAGQIFNSAGVPASGALVNTYYGGTSSTTSPAATFTTMAGNVTAANPIVANSDGRLPHEMWIAENTTLKIILTDSLANTLGTYDNLYGIGDPYASSGIAILASNNTFNGQNIFSNVSANVITVTSINVSTLTASSLTVSAIVGTLTVSTISVSNLNVSNLTISGTAILFSQQLGRTVTGSFVATTLAPTNGSLALNVAHGLGTDEVAIAMTVTSTVNTNYMAVGQRSDGALVVTRGAANSATGNTVTSGGTSGSVRITAYNNHTATQTITVQYMVIG